MRGSFVHYHHYLLIPALQGNWDFVCLLDSDEWRSRRFVMGGGIVGVGGGVAVVAAVVVEGDSRRIVIGI